MCEGQCEELDGVVEEGVERRERSKVDGKVRADGICLVREGAEFEREGLASYEFHQSICLLPPPRRREEANRI